MKLNIGNSIRELRQIHGITQESLAEGLHVTAQAVSRWESGINYPDMELIPSIANFFEISIDRLFGYSIERESKITAILDNIDRLNDESWRSDSNLDECISILRRGLEEFPGNERIMNRLALILKQAGWTRHHEWLSYDNDGHLHSDFDHHRKNPYWAEAIELFQLLSTNAVDKDIRYTAAGELVLLYGTIGETERAMLVAESMPPVALSREIMLATAANGAEQTRYYAEACISLLNAFRLQFVYALINERSNFETDMPVHKLQGLISIYNLLFDDGNMGPQHAYVCDLYLYLSRLQWEYGYRDDAFESLDAALAHARKFDTLTSDSKYSAPLTHNAHIKMPTVKPGELTHNLPNDWPMWQNPDYLSVSKEMQADTRWTAWVKRTQQLSTDAK